MTCFHPLQAYRNGSGTGITFQEGGDSGAALELPCGRCIGCRKARTSEWVTRITNEASLHDQNSFVTLTYDGGDTIEPSLNYKHFQDFIRKLRRKRPVRFYVAGEYGTENWRPHWHAILFGIGWPNSYPIGKDLYTSKELVALWGRGNTSWGEVNHTTAGYCASYCIPKVTGPRAEAHYTRLHPETGEIIQLKPEMARMSLNPGIGAKWADKYKQEIHYARDGIVLAGGTQQKVPRYYMKRLTEFKQITHKKAKTLKEIKQDNKRAIEIETERQINAKTREGDNTTERLKAREIVAIAKASEKRKTL